jgi:hypothetical protein
MTNENYNGWTNYATWRVNLEVFDGLDPRDLMIDTKDAYELGQYFKEYANDLLEIDGEGLALDYARAFISDVNWQEIAKHKLEYYDDENDDETRGVLEHAAWYDTNAELA